MKKPTEREIARLLAARATPEPPADLADRIKAEIPGSIRIERRPLQPGRRWLLPPLVEGLQPTWLAAASVLLVLGVGIVAARIPARPDDVWKWMALSGVVYIDDIVVTAPGLAEPRGIAVAAVQPATRKGVRVVVPPRQKTLPAGAAESADEAGAAAKDADKVAYAPEPAAPAAVAAPPTGALDLRVSDGRDALPGTTVTATRADAPEQSARNAVADAAGRASLRDLPPGEYTVRSERAGFEPAEARVKVAAGATSEVGVTMPPARRAEEVAVTGAAPVVPVSGQAAASRVNAARARAAVEAENEVTVAVADEAGRPREGVTVTLERIGQGALWARTARTEADGTATFRGVPPARYRALVTGPAITPAQAVFGVTSERASARAEVRVRALPRR